MVIVKDYLKPEYVVFLDCPDKKGCLDRMIEVISESPNIEDGEAFRKAVFAREEIISTGLGLGIALPHVKIPEVKDLTVAIGIHHQGVDWESLDNEPVHIIFLIAGSEAQHTLYLQTVAKIMLILKNTRRREQLLEARKAENVLALFETV